ncbi:protein CIP2A homolog [Centruroides sculpturatus]|uniref:protein CIP2A homolog n=1 Tax=Centruroides sculpturatus TaxID=218467 RepID=UPI000C6CBF1D|nr:protein CIP2A homolog [Centruroides sculpturatus]
MDISSALKSLTVAVNQHNINATEQNLIQLQRSLDILIGLTTKITDFDQLDPASLVLTESISSLSNIFLNAKSKLGLIQRVLTLLQNLIQSQKMKEFLCSKFNIYSIITVLLQNNDHIETVLNPCLLLLSNITYNLKIDQIDNLMEQLIYLLINHIENEKPDIEMLCFRILSNLCRKNSSVQSFIKNIPTSKQLYKILIDKLNHPCRYVMINSLYILANLILDNEIGEKLFSTKNINKTFQLIFNLAVSEDLQAKQTAIDLLMDLLESPNMLKKFINYKYLVPSLEKIIHSWLKNETANNTILILKLLLGFISVPNLKTQISLLLFPVNEEYNSDVILKLISWIDNSEELEVSILSIRLLIEVIKEQVTNGKTFAIELIKIKFDYIINQIEQIPVSKKEFEKQTFLLEMLIEICKMSQYKKCIATLLNINNVEGVIMNQLETNCLCLGEDPDDYSQEGVAMILNIFTFLIDLNDEINIMERLDRIIKHNNITSLVSFVIGSEDSKKIYQVMKLALTSEILCELISKTIAINNNSNCLSIEKEETLCRSNYELEKNIKNSLLEEKHLDNVDEIIKKIQNGLTFEEIKSSEIIDIYDYKIDVLMTKNQQLQELIDIKSAALQQTDHLLNQFRSQQIQHETEMLKMRNLLKQLKFQNEKLENEFKLSDQVQKELKTNLNIAEQTIKKQKKKLEEQHETISELSQTINNKQQSLENIQTEYNNVLEMNTILQRHSETMKQKQDTLNEQISDLNLEKKNLFKQLKEKENTLKELNETIQKLEESLQEKEKSCEILLTENNSKTQLIEKLQSNKCKLEEKLNCLELLCQQQEATIKDYNVQIRNLTEQLDRHKQITEMIHNLSSVPVSTSSVS